MEAKGMWRSHLTNKHPPSAGALIKAMLIRPQPSVRGKSLQPHGTMRYILLVLVIVLGAGQPALARPQDSRPSGNKESTNLVGAIGSLSGMVNSFLDISNDIASSFSRFQQDVVDSLIRRTSAIGGLAAGLGVQTTNALLGAANGALTSITAEERPTTNVQVIAADEDAQVLDPEQEEALSKVTAADGITTLDCITYEEPYYVPAVGNSQYLPGNYAAQSSSPQVFALPTGQSYGNLAQSTPYDPMETLRKALSVLVRYRTQPTSKDFL